MPKNMEKQCQETRKVKKKEERCGSMRKMVGFWTNHDQGVRKWTNLIH
jgi:hypothetical protein